MNRKYSICCMLLVICLLVGTQSGTALAAGSSYPLWMGVVQVTDANKDDLAQAINAITPNAASGTATYDPATNTLLLDGFTYTGEGVSFAEKVSGVSSTAVVYSELETLCITVLQTNVLSHTGATARYSYGIYTTGNLNITAESTGKVTVDDSSPSGAAPERSIGINLCQGELMVSGGSLSAIAADAGNISTGVWCFDGKVTVNEKGTLLGVGGDSAISRGICVSDALVINGGTAEGIAGESEKDSSISQGISADSLKTNGASSKVTGIAGKATESVGVMIWDASTLTNGSISGFADENLANGYSYGFDTDHFVQDPLGIGGGQVVVVAQGQTAAFREKPVLVDSSGHFKVWYGAHEQAANAAGEQTAESIAEHYSEKYVCVAFEPSENLPPVITEQNPPSTGDYFRAILWGLLAISSLTGLCVIGVVSAKQRR